jgi:peptide/nickel transport system substrate-binding protein
MKRFLVPLAVLLVLAFIVTGCSSGTTSTTTTSTPTATTTQPTSTTSAPPTTTVKPTTTATATATATATTPAGAGQYGGTLTLLNALSPANNTGIPWDTNMQSFWTVEYLYAEPLIVYTRKGEVEPWLAESWKVDTSAAAPSVTFTLRKGVKFHDGTDFNAAAVKWQLDKVIAAKASNAATWKSIDVVDPYTIKVGLTQFTNAVWNDFSGLNTNVFFISPTQYQQKGEDYSREHPVGTGPFKYVSFSKEQNSKWERFDGYWGGKPYLDKVEILVVKDTVTQQMAMRSGAGHVMFLQDGKTMNQMKTAQGFDIVQFPAGSSVIIGDSANPDSPYANLKVRMALDLAVDKKAANDATGAGYGFPSSQLPPLGNPARVSTIPDNPYDPVKAKSLLAEAGYPTGFKTKIITWAYDIDGALIVQQYLQKIGITSTVENVDNLKFWDYLMNGWKDSIMVWGMSSGPNWAASLKGVFPPYANINVSVAQPPGFKELIDKCLATPDISEQIKLNQQLNQLVYDNRTAVVYGTGGLGTIVSPKVHDADWCFGADMFLSWRPAKTWLSK